MMMFIRLLTLFRPYWGWAVIGIAVSLTSVLANIVLLSLSGWFITTMAVAGVTGAAVNYFTPAAIIRGCAILRTGGRYVERIITHEATFRFMAEMRSWLYQRIEVMPLAASSHYHSGDLLARLRGDIDALEGFYINILMPSCVAVLAVLAVTLTFWAYDPALAMVQLMLLLVAGLAVPFASYHTGKDAARTIVADKAALKTQMVDNIQAFAEMTLYGVAQPRMARALDLSDTLIARQQRLGTRDAIAQGANGLLANLGLWAALVMALQLFERHQIEGVHVPMLSLLALASFEAVMPLSGAFQSLESSLQAARRLFMLDGPDMDSAVTDEGTAVDEHFDLVMTDVNFSYPGRPDVLRGFNLHLRSGHVETLRGPSGQGKSSVVHLLTRFYRPDSGAIILNGRAYETYDEDAIRRHFAVTPQHPHVFTGTIRSNLLMAQPGATQSDLDKACWVACLDDLITTLPDGYDTYVGEGGTTLSGGEIRRLAIACAVLKNAPCLLLDEPTENLDTVTAATVKARLLDHVRDKAVLIITHEDDG